MSVKSCFIEEFDKSGSCVDDMIVEKSNGIMLSINKGMSARECRYVVHWDRIDSVDKILCGLFI